MSLVRFTSVFALLACFAFSILCVDHWATNARKEAVREAVDAMAPGAISQLATLTDAKEIMRVTSDFEAKTASQYTKIRNTSYAAFFLLTFVAATILSRFIFRSRVNTDMQAISPN